MHLLLELRRDPSGLQKCKNTVESPAPDGVEPLNQSYRQQSVQKYGDSSSQKKAFEATDAFGIGVVWEDRIASTRGG
jgi:hypothetical protein